MKVRESIMCWNCRTLMDKGEHDCGERWGEYAWYEYTRYHCPQCNCQIIIHKDYSLKDKD